jgi:uncharacterized alpha-E superfamily protein
LWRLGQAIERADMTTRMLGIRAAALLAAPDHADDYDEVQWMGVLRSLTAMQMYQRATRGPIDGAGVVGFLLFHQSFPRSVAGCLQRCRSALERLPRSDRTVPAVDELDAQLAKLPTFGGDGATLDAAMDELQLALGVLNDVVYDSFVRAAE